jgi:TPR repeat protein
MYVNGEGVEQDTSKASYWANKALAGSNQNVSDLAKQLCNKHNL